MMNKLLLTIIFTFVFYQLPLTCATQIKETSQTLLIKCDPQLQQSWEKLLKVPEVIELIKVIQKEGPIRLTVDHSSVANEFGAFWDPTLRRVCVALSPNLSEGELMGSLIFELCNASVNSKFAHLNQLASQRRIDKASYVRSMEYLEYQNSLNAAKLAKRGIEMGILPKDAQLFTYPSFEKHFAAQQKHGHSAFFARNYDMLCRTHTRMMNFSI